MGEKQRILEPLEVRDFHVQWLNVVKEDGGTDA